MAEQDFDGPKSHLSLDRLRKTGAYTSPKLKITKNPARDDYVAHGATLLRQLVDALPGLPPTGADPRLAIQGLKPGVLVAIETQAPKTDRKGPSKIPVAFEIPGQDLVVLSARRTADRAEEAIVFVPDDARAGLARRLRAYGANSLGNRDRPYAAQFEKVERIASADTADLFKSVTDFDDPAPRWWELWVRDLRDVPRGVIAAARAQRLDVHPEQLVFPDTTVVFVHATARQALAFASRVPGAIEEVRLGAGTIEPFLTLDHGRVTQHDFVADLAGRIIPPRTDAPTVCVLDTGVAGGHPLLSDGLAIALAVDEAWGSDDHERHDGHGTGIVSLALHGDLDQPMNDTRFIELTHSVESVKILPPRGFAPTPPPSYGIVTQSAVSLVEAIRDAEELFHRLVIEAVEATGQAVHVDDAAPIKRLVPSRVDDLLHRVAPGRRPLRAVRPHGLPHLTHDARFAAAREQPGDQLIVFDIAGLGRLTISLADTHAAESVDVLSVIAIGVRERGAELRASGVADAGINGAAQRANQLNEVAFGDARQDRLVVDGVADQRAHLARLIDRHVIRGIVDAAQEAGEPVRSETGHRRGVTFGRLLPGRRQGVANTGDLLANGANRRCRSPRGGRQHVARHAPGERTARSAPSDARSAGTNHPCQPPQGRL
ncbi:hypothetical protein QOZ99_004395 [Angulomicrobium amanitiforme]|uniref:Peptidase S8/S53 domain-containing protein n=1 Tax=Ancylobacter amanitiformis TaxID=217069 RepID=A0ABU0LXM8_9HYPH|nr:hypothetical protein [Ancylobacter amanitiformis]